MQKNKKNGPLKLRFLVCRSAKHLLNSNLLSRNFHPLLLSLDAEEVKGEQPTGQQINAKATNENKER